MQRKGTSPISSCLVKRVTRATRLQLAAIFTFRLAKHLDFTAISDDENSDSGFAVTSDILPKKVRGRKPIKREEDVEEDDDVADTKITNGGVDDDEDEDEDDEDMEEDE